jgi:Zn-dependent protease with chaperone function
VEKLRTPLMVNAVYLLLLGLATLSSSAVRSVFGYDVKDPGVLLVLSAAFLGLFVIAWAIASNPEKHGDLAMPVVIALIIFIVWLLWGWWISHIYTARNVMLPLIVNIALAIWIWWAKPKA